MTNRLRILLLDQSRYQAMLIERMLAEVVESPVVARFESGTAAVRELLVTHYDIAIMNIDYLERPVDLVQAARLARPAMSLIVVGAKETPHKVAAAIESVPNCQACWTGDPAARLPQAIRYAIGTTRHSKSDTSSRTPGVAEPVLAG